MAATWQDLTIEPASAPVHGEPDPRRWIVLIVLCLALLVVGIDGTIVNVALPSLVRELNASSSQLQWIVDAYTIVFASFLLIAGNTGDRLGRKRCFIVGLVVFAGGSLGCSLVSSAGSLIFLRALQGLGAAFIMPATLSILANVFTDAAERARAISLWAGVSGLGVAIGPLAGGYLLGHFWWGAIFLVNVPLVAIAVIAAVVIVPESRDEHAAKLDLVGTTLSVVGLVSLLYGIIEGPSRGWTEPIVVIAFVVAVVVLTSFVVWEGRTDHPILDVSFFKNPRFTAASVAVTLVFFAMFGSLFFVSQYLQFVLGYSALKSGACLLPVAATLMVTAPLSAKLVARAGTKRVVTLGLVLVAVALLVFSRVSDSSGYGLVALVLVIIGVGMGLAMAPATDSIMGSLPPEKAGVGSAMNDTTREIGGALGVAIMGSITAAVYAAKVSESASYKALLQSSPAAAAAVKDSVGSASIVAAKLPDAVRRAVTAAANDAFIHGIDRTVIIGAVIALLGAGVAYVFLPARAEGDEQLDELIDAAALRLEDPAQRLGLARAALGLLADAGMSSLTYSGIAARSGVGTATLERYWTNRVDAVTDALAEVFNAHPVADTGDIRADLYAYVHAVGEVLSAPRARQVLGALVAEAATDPALATALRDRVVAPRRAELARRLNADLPRLRVPIEVALDQLVGPIYHRALIVDAPVGDDLVRAVVDGVVWGDPVSADPAIGVASGDPALGDGS
ncbi:MAG: putative integral rane efflux protein [Ilumatobacteraceae bacterium]|nr:putative integral rane efflux protein [Ilumatobacteraceae bacterium]